MSQPQLQSGRMHRLRLVGRFLVDWIDVLLAASLALLFSYFGIKNTLENDELSQATIALLGVLALVAVKDRWERRKGVASIEEALADFKTDKPWHVLSESVTWDISTATTAIVTDIRDIRFLQSETVSLYEFANTPPGGKIASWTCEGGRIGETARSWPVVHTFLGPNSRHYYIVSLEDMWERGDCVRWTSLRELEHCFDADTESVSKTILMPTDTIEMHVVWPDTRPPTAVRLRRHGVPVTELKAKKSSGRIRALAVVRNPRVGEVITLQWDW